MTTSPERVDDLYVGNGPVSIAYGNIAQRRDVEVRRLIVDKSAVQRAVLTDPDVTEIEVLAVTSVRPRDAVTRVPSAREISTSGAVQTWLAGARVEAGTPLSIISRHARAEESISG